MKATKKIVGASCALVAAVALSAGSTFAWFASNSEVTADGMHVQATVPTNLYIKEGYISTASGVNKTSIELTTSAKNLSPAAISTAAVTGATIATGTVSDGKLYVVEALSYDEGKKPTATSSGTPATYGQRGTITADISAKDPGAVWTGDTYGESKTYNQVDYVYSADMTLANKSKEADIDGTVTISVNSSVTSVSQTISFLRVGFLIGSTDGTDWSYTYVSAANDITIASNNITSGTKYVYNDTAKTVTVSFAKLIAGFESNGVRTITFLAWFDGDDDDCFVNNAVSVNEFNLSVDYEAKAVTATESGS